MDPKVKKLLCLMISMTYEPVKIGTNEKELIRLLAEVITEHPDQYSNRFDEIDDMIVML